MCNYKDLYGEDILTLSSAPSSIEPLALFDGEATIHSRICGSIVTTQVLLSKEAPYHVVNFSYQCHASILGHAACVLLNRCIRGCTEQKLLWLTHKMERLLEAKGEIFTQLPWTTFNIFEQAQLYKQKHSSILAVFHCVIQAISQHKDKLGKKAFSFFEKFYQNGNKNPVILLATHNKGKTIEFSEKMKPFSYSVGSLSNFGFLPPDETGSSFEENALIKARKGFYFYSKSKNLTIPMQMPIAPILADDSGLCVETLDNDPGIHSARWAEEGIEEEAGEVIIKRNFSHARARIQKQLKKSNAEPPYYAFFLCVLALFFSEETYFLGKGTIHGTLCFPERGKNGFGYDSIFIPNGYEETLAEMDADLKNNISHRSLAIDDLFYQIGR